MKARERTRSAAGSRRALPLLVLVLFAVVSAGGAWFLSWKIADGERQVAAGQQELASAAPVMEEGREELEAGKQRLSEGREEYRDARNNPFLVWADRLFKGGTGFENAREKIVEGERKVADGAERIRAGESRLDAGRQELRVGGNQLRLAGVARDACAAATVLFAGAAIVLGLRWRRDGALEPRALHPRRLP